MGVVGAALGTTLATGFVTLFGRYLVALPAAALGLVTLLGLGGLYLALLFETYVPGGINYVRFWTGRWKAVSRRYRPSNG
jgi:Na+-driven multidrug efflux pump